MSWFDNIVTAVQDIRTKDSNHETLPTYIKESLSTLSKYDRLSHTILQEIKIEEKRLLDNFEAECKDKSAAELLDLDETPYQEGLKKLNLKRQRLSTLYDYQMKIATNCYDIMDKKIAAFDAAMQPLAQQFPNILPTTATSDDNNIKSYKKKKSSSVAADKTGDDFDAILDSLSLDPNEQKYCLCKRVSYGEMVACENQDCRIEWFHFKCVGLKKAPIDPWYCPQCSSANRQSSSKLSSSPTPAAALERDVDEDVEEE